MALELWTQPPILATFLNSLYFSSTSVREDAPSARSAGCVAYLLPLTSLCPPPSHRPLQVGVEIIQRAIRRPMKTIANNAGLEGDVIVGKLLEMVRGWCDGVVKWAVGLGSSGAAHSCAKPPT